MTFCKWSFEIECIQYAGSWFSHNTASFTFVFIALDRFYRIEQKKMLQTINSNFTNIILFNSTMEFKTAFHSITIRSLIDILIHNIIFICISLHTHNAIDNG